MIIIYVYTKRISLESFVNTPSFAKTEVNIIVCFSMHDKNSAMSKTSNRFSHYLFNCYVGNRNTISVNSTGRIHRNTFLN